MYYVQVLFNDQWHNLYGYAPTGWQQAIERHAAYMLSYRDRDYRIVPA